LRRYPEEFEAVWEEYRPIASPNATKADAARAFARLSKPDKAACWTGVVRYVQWVVDERTRRPDAPVQHLSTFINRRGWERFLEEVAA
jgi:dissimilatory sulfite reductase (desulfoviridin) alpha/beta subunit